MPQRNFFKRKWQIKHKATHYIYNQINKHTTRASGDTSIIVKNTFPQSQINLNTNLQAIAVSVTLHKTISICSLTIHSHPTPNSNIIELELEDLIQLPKPFILMGDFNSHNQIWSSRDTNERGHTIENFMDKNNLCLLKNTPPLPSSCNRYTLSNRSDLKWSYNLFGKPMRITAEVTTIQSFLKDLNAN